MVQAETGQEQGDLQQHPPLRGYIAELDAAEALDIGDIDDLGARYAALREQLPHLNVLGGCCGTDARHIGRHPPALHDVIGRGVGAVSGRRRP